jgi:hypothetical protein
MTSPTLIDEIVAEVRFHNSSATPQEVSEGVASILSKEILPEVLKNLTLPRFPSYRSVATAERSRKKRKTRLDRSKGLGDSRRVIQQIEYVRTRMGWDGSDDLKPTVYITDSPSLHYVPKTYSPLAREGPRKEALRKESDVEKEPQPTEKESDNGTSQKIPKPIEKNPIVLSETAQRKIVSEPIFEEVFKNIEIQLRNAIVNRKLETEIDVTCKTDVEISSWNKCVLTVHPSSDLDFKARMNIATVFDLIVRKTINDLKNSADGNAIEYLKNLNRNLFVHVDL